MKFFLPYIDFLSLILSVSEWRTRTCRVTTISEKFDLPRHWNSCSRACGHFKNPPFSFPHSLFVCISSPLVPLSITGSSDTLPWLKNAAHQTPPMMHKTTPYRCFPPNARSPSTLLLTPTPASSESPFLLPRPAPNGPTDTPPRSSFFFSTLLRSKSFFLFIIILSIFAHFVFLVYIWIIR